MAGPKEPKIWQGQKDLRVRGAAPPCLRCWPCTRDPSIKTHLREREREERERESADKRKSDRGSVSEGTDTNGKYGMVFKSGGTAFATATNTHHYRTNARVSERE